MSYPPLGGQYPPPGGQYPPPGGQYQRPPGKGLAITALVLGIIALLSSWTVFGGIGFGVLAVIFGLIALIKARSGTAGGGVMAGFGLVLGLLSIVIGVLVGVFAWKVVEETGGADYVSCLNKAGNDQTAIQKCLDDFSTTLESKFPTTPSPAR
ncbi:DUF4190 domain-containing protein [Nocardia sp. NPDC059177]|uniref:DUF4190 domain-containing protein n=1 Tax=Nocardia sp. NPDC059177 TaxID=3346759 RepID=UPI0036B3CA7E